MKYISLVFLTLLLLIGDVSAVTRFISNYFADKSTKDTKKAEPETAASESKVNMSDDGTTVVVGSTEAEIALAKKLEANKSSDPWW